jgi:hypothetical protein
MRGYFKVWDISKNEVVRYLKIDIVPDGSEFTIEQFKPENKEQAICEYVNPQAMEQKLNTCCWPFFSFASKYEWSPIE